MNQKTNIKKKEASAVMQSLLSGVVPREGLEHIAVGRKKEISQVLKELDSVGSGSAIMKFFIGDYGSGKSFMLSIIRHIALQNKFVVAEADLSPERRLYAQDGKALATYTNLLNSLSTKAKPGGGALPIILQKWINQIQTRIVNNQDMEGIGYNSKEFLKIVQQEIRKEISRLEDLSGGFDFAEVINAYFRGYMEDDENLTRSALRWLKGEYRNKPDAYKALGVRSIITDDNWFDYLKVISNFIKNIGYSGLIINIDEAINIYKITHQQARNKNYDTILYIYNEINQGRCEHIYFLVAGTPEFLLDERRGIASYEALASRLAMNRFETDVYRDFTQPVIRLQPLKSEEMYTLLLKLLDIHQVYYDYQCKVSDSDIEGFLTKTLTRPGAKEKITAREVIKTFLQGLNILEQNPEMDKSQMFANLEPKNVPQVNDDNIMDRFISS